MPDLYPMLFKPVLKDYIWGGRNLEKFGRDLPECGTIAESWEISSHEDGVTQIENGIFAGRSLQKVFEVFGVNLVGANYQWAVEQEKFPLLVKLLDAEQRLSLQVHPDNFYAQKHEENELGKTEMWVVLDAKPGAAIIYGLSEDITPEVLRRAILNRELESYLNKIYIARGDHICVPSGTLHSILEGAVIAEIQQNSNITYRVYDWNRVDGNAKHRELHIDKALDVINFDQVNCSLSQPKSIEKQTDFICERLCKNEIFTTERFRMKPDCNYSGVCNGSSLEIWGVLAGEAVISGYPLGGVKFILLPACLGPFNVFTQKGAELLRIYSEGTSTN